MSVHPLGNTKLRTPETFAKYHDNSKRKMAGCFICHGADDLMLNSTLWKLNINDFPYDAVAEIHLLLSPVRHAATAADLTIEEKADLERIKEMLGAENIFDTVIENLARGRTFFPHYHLHLIQWKRV